jgi:sarcosine oxidase subunit gamma
MGRLASVDIAAVPAGSRRVLRLAPEAATQLGAVGPWRLDLPINRSALQEDCLSARLGPDEWLLLGPEPAPNAELRGVFHSLVDVSARDVGLTVSGGGADLAINGGCPLDLGETAFPVGAASRTLLAKAEIVLIRLNASSFRIEARRSFAGYVLRQLQAAR